MDGGLVVPEWQFTNDSNDLRKCQKITKYIFGHNDGSDKSGWGQTMKFLFSFLENFVRKLGVIELY